LCVEARGARVKNVAVDSLPAGMVRCSMANVTALLGDRADVVVLGDFGRDAGIRFCAAIATHERDRIASQLPGGAVFFDEYRRLAMTLVGDVRYVKAPWLEAAREWLDGRILVGFPDGLTIEQVVPRLAGLALAAMAGPAGRGAREITLALPCNTLAPAAWALGEMLGAPESLEATLARAQVTLDEAGAVSLRALGRGLRVDVPTVPEAVLGSLDDSVETLLPLGTTGIAALYREAAARCQSRVRVVDPEPDWQRSALLAISAAVAGERSAGHDALSRIDRAAREVYGESLVVVEACTDLDFGVGLDSNGVFARSIVEMAYRGTDTD
jgi:hypothetical protein